MQMLIEEICELECKAERERLIKDFGPSERAPPRRRRSAARAASSSSRSRSSSCAATCSLT